MTLGEIKVEALKIMFAAYSNDFSVGELEHIARDDNYASYLADMVGSINRCFANIENKGVLKSKCIPLENGTENDYSVSYDLDSIEDFYRIERVIGKKDGLYYPSVEYVVEGNNLILFDKDAVYKLVYKPRIKRITSYTPDSEDIGVDDSIAVLIPYYIKGDVYRDDEPAEAAEARNWYEAAISEISMHDNSKQTYVHRAYNIEGV